MPAVQEDRRRCCWRMGKTGSRQRSPQAEEESGGWRNVKVSSELIGGLTMLARVCSGACYQGRP